MHCQVKCELIVSGFFSHFVSLCLTVISKRIELESRGWSQIEGNLMLIMDLIKFLTFRSCIVEINAIV